MMILVQTGHKTRPLRARVRARTPRTPRSSYEHALESRERFDAIEQQRIPGFRSVWLYVIGVSIAAADLWGALRASANRLR